jgi:hypothetical protein
VLTHEGWVTEWALLLVRRLVNLAFVAFSQALQ